MTVRLFFKISFDYSCTSLEQIKLGERGGKKAVGCVFC